MDPLVGLITYLGALLAGMLFGGAYMSNKLVRRFNKMKAEIQHEIDLDMEEVAGCYLPSMSYVLLVMSGIRIKVGQIKIN